MNFNLKNINFLAYIVTPWQVKGTEAFIKHMKSQGIVPHGFIFLAEHTTTGRCIYREDFNDAPSTIEIIEITDGADIFYNENKIVNKIKKLFALISISKRPNCFVLNAGVVDLRWISFVHSIINKEIKYVLLDDGTGGYTNYNGLSNNSWKYRIIYSIDMFFLKRKNAVYDFRLLKNNNGKYILNEKISNYYVSTFHTNITNEISSKFSEAVVVNTQCLFDNKELNKEEDLQVWKILHEQIPDETKILIKPHPREVSLYRYSFLNWDIITNLSVTQEEILASLEIKPKCIIGITSSTLINTRALFNIRTISLAYFLLKQDIPKGLQKDVKDFIRMYDGIVDMPKTKDELRKIIMEVVGLDVSEQ